MTSKWRDVLIADKAVAQTAANSVDTLESYSTATTTQLSALSGYVIYEITGADATSFLQGQFCNDLAEVSSSQAQITGYCTPKGRLLALPTIVGFDAGYRLVVPHDIADAFIKRLSMFVMRSDVSIAALDDWAAIGITVSADTADEFVSLAGPLPNGMLSVSGTEDAQLIRWHDDHSGPQARQRYLRLATVDSQLELWTHCVNAGRHSDNAWRLSDISAGIPSITQGVLESFVPQMLNLQLINGLSFKKGCYPGQEIVARMQYLGKLKRHMRIFTMTYEAGAFDIDETFTAGAALRAGTDENAGIVVDALPVGKDVALVLAVTKVSSNDDPLTLAGVPLAPRAMPYELASASSQD